MILLLLAACHRDGEAPYDSDAQPLAVAVADAGPDVGVEVGVEVAFDAGDSEGVAFLWDLGDGTSAETASVRHTYAEPGRYTAILQVTGEDGSRQADSARVTVWLPPADPAPVASSTVALDEARGRIWVVTPEADAVAAVALDGSGADVVSVCSEPVAIALSGDRVAVACEGNASLTLLDAETGAVWRDVSLPERSRPVAVVGRDGVFWVALAATGQIARVESGELSDLFEVGPDLRGLALAPDGRLYASRFRSSDSGGEIFVLDPTLDEVHSIPLACDESADSDTTNRGVPNLLGSLAISPDGGSLLVPGLHANRFRGTWRDGQALTHETTSRAILGLVDLSSGVEAPKRRKQFDDQDRSDALVFSPHGDLVYVSHPGTATVHVLDATSFDIAGSLLDAGAAVAGLAISSDGDTLFVHAWLDRELRAYDVGELGAVPALLWATSVIRSEPLPSHVLLGKQIFHDSSDLRMAKDGYLTCASCHPGGDHDGRTWDFTDRGEGLRNTITLLGRAGTGMGPLHWTANFDEVQDFENDIRGAFGGTGFLSESDWVETSDTLGAAKAGRSEELDALAAYVGSLLQTPASPYDGDEEGEDLFTIKGCYDCHPGPLYTDSDLATSPRYDIGTLDESSGGRLGGTLDGLDTPTLLGIWATAPYLHNGAAPTIEDAISAHDPARIDGGVLSAGEISSLASWIRSL